MWTASRLDRMKHNDHSYLFQKRNIITASLRVNTTFIYFMKIQGLDLIGCASQCSCWRHYFESEDYLQGKPKIYDRATIAFVHCFLLEDVAYGETNLLVLSWRCQCCCFKKWISVAGPSFFLIILSSFFWLCASFMPLGHNIVAKGILWKLWRSNCWSIKSELYCPHDIILDS